MQPLLSILTPAIPERLPKLQRLALLLEPQLRQFPHSVEWLSFVDPRGCRTIGEKRDDLVQLARGQFVAFVDDDDLVQPTYVASLVQALSVVVADNEPVDVITFRQEAIIERHRSEVRFNLRAGNEAFNPGGVTQRAAWHVCAWRSSLAKRFHFEASNYGEDWSWARHLNLDARGEIHIPEILHTYIFDSAISAAPAPTHE
jgi:glycosyltransferase involved in cell wall biosynthesis